MTGTALALPDDSVATIPVTFLDQFGRTVPAPAGTSFAASDADVTVSFDGTGTLTVTPVADGTATVTASGLQGELDVTVSAPVPTTVVFGTPSFAPLNPPAAG